jgi:hypothetical protein
MRNKGRKNYKHIIVAPHPDDEIIGCYSILMKHDVLVLYANLDAVMLAPEFLKFHYKQCKESLFEGYINRGVRFYFPDPYFETHHEHRRWGAFGEHLLRTGEDVVFYSVNMQAPYVHDCPNVAHKSYCLNRVYSDKNDLWKYDHKYFLFEGYCKWIIEKQDDED